MPETILAVPNPHRSVAHHTTAHTSMAPSLNTLRLAQRLEQGGFSRQQANTQADAMAELLNANALGCPTSADLHLMEESLITEMDSRFEKFSSRINASIIQVDLRTPFAGLASDVRNLKWLVGLTLMGTCATLAKQWIS